MGGEAEKSDWVARYRRLQWRQVLLERQLGKLRSWTPEDENDPSPKDDNREQLEQEEKMLTSDLDLLRGMYAEEEYRDEAEGWSRRQLQQLTRLVDRGGLDLPRAAAMCGRSEDDIYRQWERERRKKDKRKADVLRWKQERLADLAESGNIKNVCSKNRGVSEEVRERIAAWREEKAERLRQEQADREHKEEILRLRTRREVQQWRQRVGQRAEWRQKSEDDVDQPRVQEVEKALRRLHLARLRERDAEIVRKRKGEMERRRSDREPSIPSTTASQAPRDPERLFRPTRVWQERVKTADLRQEYSDRSSFVLHIQKRSVPSWRMTS